MANTVDSPEYDLFDYDSTEGKTLDEAISGAKEAAKSNPEAVFRVVPVDREMTAFRIQKVHRNELYGHLLSRILKYWASHSSR